MSGPRLMEATSVEPTLQQLGSYFFPPPVIDELRNFGVQHVLISPDPRAFGLPWPALMTGESRSFIDEPWTFSVIAGPHALRRDVRASNICNGLAAFAPLPEVNRDYGGNEELRILEREFPGVQVFRAEDASLGEFTSAWSRFGIIHVRTHGRGVKDLHLPVLADGVWKEPVVGRTSPMLVLAACKTGASVRRGMDVFGCVELAQRSGVRSIVAPIVSVDGHATLAWMEPFYQSLAAGKRVAQATKDACLSARSLLVHPAFWAQFGLFGSPS